MKNITLIFTIFLIFSHWGCCSSENSRSNEGLQKNSPENVTHSSRSEGMAAIKPNAVEVEAEIDSIIIFDELNYQLNVNIISVRSIENVEAISDIGNQLILTPEFFINEDNTIDKENERNLKLLQVRDLKHGEKFKGIISLNPSGKWVLTNIINK